MRLKFFRTSKASKTFQSTHPRGVRLGKNLYVDFETIISIHAPARGATEVQSIITSGDLDFNPRAREGCDVPKAWADEANDNFNPRTREGCDTVPACLYAVFCLFQSTHPRGVRHTYGPTTAERLQISIHAPARGATKVLDQGRRGTLHFNPRTREGCDRVLDVPGILDVVFQSTHPRGVRRPWTLGTWVGWNDFNPRTREGCDDHLEEIGAIEYDISIHAPARGATYCHRQDMPIELISIHAPARGATKPVVRVSALRIISIHAPARGATSLIPPFCCSCFIFQSTHPRGVRQHRRCNYCKFCYYFNPRTREGCDLLPPPRYAHRVDFNPRTREGCDETRCQGLGPADYFNPRTREGCDFIDTAFLLFMFHISIHAPARGATAPAVQLL